MHRHIFWFSWRVQRHLQKYYKSYCDNCSTRAPARGLETISHVVLKDERRQTGVWGYHNLAVGTKVNSNSHCKQGKPKIEEYLQDDVTER